MTKLLWIKEGGKIPAGHRLLRVLMQEIRPDGIGTSSARWILCELEILDGAA